MKDIKLFNMVFVKTILFSNKFLIWYDIRLIFTKKIKECHSFFRYLEDVWFSSERENLINLKWYDGFWEYN